MLVSEDVKMQIEDALQDAAYILMDLPGYDPAEAMRLVQEMVTAELFYQAGE